MLNSRFNHSRFVALAAFSGVVSVMLLSLIACGQQGKNVAAEANEGSTAKTESVNLIPFRKGEKWGFSDANKKLVIQPLYDVALPFYEGLARVALKRAPRTDHRDPRTNPRPLSYYRWGFIDENGKEVAPLKYDAVESFSEGLAKVMMGDKVGFIDKNGREVIPVKYGDAGSFSDGLAGVILNNKISYIDKSGREVIALIFRGESFYEGMAVVSFGYSKFGFIDKRGRQVVPFKYDLAGAFSEGLAMVLLEGKGSGFIDKTGREVIPLRYGYAHPFSEGLAAAGLNEKWGFIDKYGKEVIPFKYDDAGSFSDGLAAVKVNGKYGYIDKSGKEVIPLKYDFANAFSDGLAAAKVNGKWGFINKSGKEVTLFKYSEAESFSGGVARVNRRDNGYYIGRDGTEYYEVIATPLTVRDISHYDKLGPLNVSVGDTLSAGFAEVRGFIWEHWTPKRLSYVVVTLHSKEGESKTLHMFMEPDDGHIWNLSIKIEGAIEQPEEYKVYVIDRIEIPADERSKRIMIPNEVKRKPDSYRLEFKDKDGRVMTEW